MFPMEIKTERPPERRAGERNGVLGAGSPAATTPAEACTAETGWRDPSRAQAGFFKLLSNPVSPRSGHTFSTAFSTMSEAGQGRVPC